jgi:hypothetical protein
MPRVHAAAAIPHCRLGAPRTVREIAVQRPLARSLHLHEPTHDVDREQGAPCPFGHPPDPSDFRAFAPVPQVAPERPSAIAHSARDESRSRAFCICARSTSGAAMRTIMPSERCQYAPSGPARTNSKSRNPYGLAKFSFARFISFASRLLSCIPRAGKKKPGADLVSAAGLFAREKLIRLRIVSLEIGPALDCIACRSRGVAACMRAPTRRERQSGFSDVRHAVSPPFVTPSRAPNAHDQRRSSRRREQDCQKGKETETDLPTVPPSHLAECLPVGEATSSRPRRLAPTPTGRTTSCTRHGTNRSPGRQGPWRESDVCVACGS